MESPSNPNFQGSNRDRMRFAEDLFPSISQQNHLQIESMRQEPGSTEQFLQDLILSNPTSEQNHSVNNPTAAEAESMRERQPERGQRIRADISSADSHSRIPENTARDLIVRKRAADRRYREKKKEEQKRMKLDLATLEAQNEFLKEESKKLKIQLKEYEKLKKKYEKQHENKQRMKFNMKGLKAENKSLKNENILATEKFQTQLEELGNWKKKYEKQHEIEQQMKCTLETLQRESVLTTQKFQTQLEELGNWKKYEKQHETEQQMRSTLETLKAEIESLKNGSVLAMQKFQTQSEELDNWKKYKKQYFTLETLQHESVLATEKFQTQSKELDNWKKNYEKQQATFPCLSRVRVLTLIGLGVQSGLPSFFLQSLANLEKLVVSKGSFDEIFYCESLSIGERPADTPTQFPPVFYNLRTLKVLECSKLMSLVPSIVSFGNLQSLIVSRCHRLINLVRYSTAKSLVHLTRMSITDCHLVEEIVACLEDDVKDGIVFSKLKCLQLCGLPRLSSFCSVKCKLEFPSLEDIILMDCPSMPIFSMDEIRMPKLQDIRLTTDVYEWFWDGNLHSIIQLKFMQKSGGDSEN